MASIRQEVEQEKERLRLETEKEVEQLKERSSSQQESEEEITTPLATDGEVEGDISPDMTTVHPETGFDGLKDWSGSQSGSLKQESTSNSEAVHGWVKPFHNRQVVGKESSELPPISPLTPNSNQNQNTVYVTIKVDNFHAVVSCVNCSFQWCTK